MQQQEVAGSMPMPDGVRIGYRLWRAGAGRPVLVMLHGLGSNLTRWSEFVQTTSLKSDWDLLRLDLRGHGTSLCRGPIGREQWTADLLRVLKGEGYTRAVLLGHSLGAQLAVQAAAAPRQVHGLILIDPVFPNALHGRLGLLVRLRFLLRPLVRVVLLANRLGVRRRRIPPRDLRALDAATRIRLARGEHIATLYADPLSDLRHVPLATYLQDVHELLRPLPDPRTIQAPVLLLVSRHAALADPAARAAMLARFAHASMETIEADHWPLTERPQETREAIERWCTELLREGGRLAVE